VILTIQQRISLGLIQDFQLNGGSGFPAAICLAGLYFFIVLFTLTGCAATAGKKSAGVVHSREATEIWHSYEVLANYNYYISGAESRPWYIIGIDNKYHLTSKNWKPVDLTPEMLNQGTVTRPAKSTGRKDKKIFIKKYGYL
jgi:hypothetical protein